MTKPDALPGHPLRIPVLAVLGGDGLILSELPVSWGSPLAELEPELAVEGHAVWGRIAPRDGAPGFAVHEFDEPWEMDVSFLYWLYGVRQLAGVPMKVSDAARDSASSAGVSRSAHKKRPCRAVDIQVYNAEHRARIAIAAILLGCRRVGVYPGKDRRALKGWPPDATDASGLHLDCETHVENPSPRMWTRF